MSYQNAPVVKLPFGEYSNRAKLKYNSLEKVLPPIPKPIHRGKTRSCIPCSEVLGDIPSTPYFGSSPRHNSPDKVNCESISEKKPMKKVTFFDTCTSKFNSVDSTRNKDSINQLRNFKVKLRREIIFHSTMQKRKQFNLDTVRIRNFPWEVFTIPK